MVPVTKDGKQDPILLATSADAPEENPLDLTDVQKLVISNTDNTPVTAEELLSLTVVACEGFSPAPRSNSTLPSSGRSTTPSGETTPAVLDCVHSVTQDDIKDGKTFDTPNGDSGLTTRPT